MYVFTHIIPFVDYILFLWGYLDTCQFSPYCKHCCFKPLCVSVHMCKSFYIEYYISTSEMCNLIQRGYQLVFRSSCIRLYNYSRSLPTHKFFLNVCFCQLIECDHHLKKNYMYPSCPFPLRPLPLSSQ